MHCVTTTGWVASWLSPRMTHAHTFASHTYHSSVALQSIVRGKCTKYHACVKLEVDCTVCVQQPHAPHGSSIANGIGSLLFYLVKSLIAD